MFVLTKKVKQQQQKQNTKSNIKILPESETSRTQSDALPMDLRVNCNYRLLLSYLTVSPQRIETSINISYFRATQFYFFLYYFYMHG